MTLPCEHQNISWLSDFCREFDSQNSFREDEKISSFRFIFHILRKLLQDFQSVFCIRIIIRSDSDIGVLIYYFSHFRSLSFVSHTRRSESDDESTSSFYSCEIFKCFF